MEKQIQAQYKTTERLSKEVIEEILKVHKKEGLTAENLLEVAKRRRSPLHNFFDWNDSTASNQWRLQQARILINEVKIVVEDKVMFAFENVHIDVMKSDSKKGIMKKVYKPILEVMSNVDYKKEITEVALQNLTYWQNKYKDLSILEPIFKATREVKERWQKKQ